MSTNDKFKLVGRQTYLSQEIQNVYHFIQLGGGGGAADLQAEFRNTWVPAIATVQNVGVNHVGAITINLDNDEDFDDVVYLSPVAGSVTGEGLPSYASWTFRINRTSRSFRNGFKRFAGISESSAAGNAEVAGFKATLEALGVTLSADLDDGTNTWALIIPRYTGTPPALTAWDIAKSVSYSHIGTQNSRKLGRGV